MTTDEKIIEALRTHAGPLLTKELQKITGLTRGPVTASIRRLRASGAVVVKTETRYDEIMTGGKRMRAPRKYQVIRLAGAL